MWLILLLFRLFGAAWECGNTGKWDQIHQTDEYISSPGPFLRSMDWFPMRIHMRPITPLDAETEQALTADLNWFSSLLSVRRLQEPLRSEGCEAYGLAGLGETYSADYVLYVLVDNEESMYAARTVLCAVEGGNSPGAPISGLLILYPHAIKTMSISERSAMFRHEITHLLAISTFLFPRYRSQAGSVYVQPLTWVQSRNETIPVLRTPRVLAKAREAFGCAEIEGVELDTDIEEEIEAHWRGRMMHMDYMGSSGGSVYSEITLAVFEDSGWYQVQTNAGDKLLYGQKRGCGFLSSRCIAAEKANFPEFCDTSSGDLCTGNLLFKATCGLHRYTSPLPPSYQWFSDAYIGGTSQHLDYCPIPVPDLDGDCSGNSAIPSLINTEAYGEMACPSCLCFTGSYIKPQWALKKMPIHSGCHRVECFDDFAMVYIGKEAVKCPKMGGIVSDLKDFIGNITCPAHNALCPLALCPANCSGNGACRGTGCACLAGYYGTDCGKQCHVTCSSCSGPEAEDCLSCFDQALLSPLGTCECPIGLLYSAENRSCVWDTLTCHPQCLTCSGPTSTNCLSCFQSAHIDENSSCECETGLIWSQEAEKCLPCAPHCLACVGPAENDCIQCFAHAELTAQPGACHCEHGFFPDISGCSPCNSVCSTCESDEIDACLSCKAASARLINGKCTCLAGFYLMISGEECLSCYPTCSSCYGPSAYHCIACGIASVLDPVSNQCICEEGFIRSPDLTACQISPSSLICVANLTPLSVLLLLFFVQLFAGKRFISQELKNSPQSPNVSTELPLLHASLAHSEPSAVLNPAVTSSRAVHSRAHWVFRLGVLVTVLIWGGFTLEFIYYVSYSEPNDENSTKGSIFTFNINDSAYILLTFVITFSLNYVFFRLYLAYRISGKPKQLWTAAIIALCLSLGAISGTAVLAVYICGESGALWMSGFYVLFGLEIGISQLVLRTICQSLP